MRNYLCASWCEFSISALSKQDRHKHRRYVARKTSLVFALKATCEHQQPLRPISQANGWAHASQDCDIRSTGRLDLNLSRSLMPLRTEPSATRPVDSGQ